MTEVEIVTLDGDTTILSDAVVTAFAAGLRGHLLASTEAEYDEARVLWNGMMDKRPALIVRCQGVSDVRAAVNFAREHRALTAVRGGGHNVAGNGACDGGLMIDLSLMKGVHVSPKDAIVRAQGGATLGDLDAETRVFGLSIPAGVVSTTGIGGLTLGGGTGWQVRKHGLTIDNLLSVEIVTADGEVRVASKDENSDLFFAVRGGGGNFGVATSFEYQAHAMGPDAWVYATFYPLEASRHVARVFCDFMADAPPEFGGSLLFWMVPPDPNYPENHWGKPSVAVFLVYAGDPKEGARLTEPLDQNFGPAMCDLTGPRPWSGSPESVQQMSDEYFPIATLQYYWKSMFLSSITDAFLDRLVEVASALPSEHTFLLLEPLAGAINQVGADETAFGRRDMKYMFEVNAGWEGSTDAETIIAWARDKWAAMREFSTGGLYINFPGFGEEGEALVRAAVGGSSHDRLGKIKAKYDPMNLFRLNQNITPQSDEAENLRPAVMLGP